MLVWFHLETVPAFLREAVARAQRAALRPAILKELGEDFKDPPEIEALQEHLDGETDRGSALVAAAFVGDRLADLLRAALIDDQRAVDDLLENRGLTQYAERVSACFCLGLLPELVRDDLRIVGQIRNRFRHVSDRVSFSTPEIRNLVSNMRIGSVAPGEPRVQFEAHVKVLLGIIGAVTEDTEHATAAGDVDMAVVDTMMAEHHRKVDDAVKQVLTRISTSPYAKAYRRGRAFARFLGLGKKEPESG